MKQSIVNKLLENNSIISRMIGEGSMNIILTNLEKALKSKIEGDIVELGCYKGTVSLFIRRLLDSYDSDKEFHVYDSFEGLPEKKMQDENTESINYKKGSCKCSKKDLIDSFKKANLKLPIIHKGWFKNIPDSEFPNKICFAFFDGDFYDSIKSSFEKVYPKLSKNGIIIVHDYNQPSKILPGVKKACNDFLIDKNEVSISHVLSLIMIKKLK